jgi:2-oxo-4-hydroxy-4-carboxy-5-ureidoimidazoline decarboxylase
MGTSRVVSAAAELDAMALAAARESLRRCCGSTAWVDGMIARRPFRDDATLHAAADSVWAEMGREDILEAFSHHPRIGSDLAALREKFAATASWSAGEQASVTTADEATLVALRDGNVAYEARFGWIFIVCATGKSAAQMLELLRARLPNAPAPELRIAAGEQAKITHLRLDKLAASGG